MEFSLVSMVVLNKYLPVTFLLGAQCHLQIFHNSISKTLCCPKYAVFPESLLLHDYLTICWQKEIMWPLYEKKNRALVLFWIPFLRPRKCDAEQAEVEHATGNIAAHADILRALSGVPPPLTSAEMKNYFHSTAVCPPFKETNQHWLIVLCIANHMVPYKTQVYPKLENSLWLVHNPRMEVVFRFSRR